MQPRDSVHHETIRLVSLNFRLRKRMATVLSIIGNLARLPPAFYIQGWIPRRNLCVMPEDETIERAHEDEREGLSPSSSCARSIVSSSGITKQSNGHTKMKVRALHVHLPPRRANSCA